MKLNVCPKQVTYLLNKLTIVSKARYVQLIASKETQSICFRGANECVQVTTSSIQCQVSQSASYGFDYYVLKDLISSLRTAETICLNCTATHIDVSSDKTQAKYKVAAISANDVPVDIHSRESLPKVTITVDSKKLGSALASVLKPAPKNDFRYYLNGINFEYHSEAEDDDYDGQLLVLLATDGSRMNVCEIEVNGYGIDRNFIIPNNVENPFIDYLLRLTASYSGELQLKFSDYFAELFTPEGDRIRTKLIDHKYVDWEKLIFQDVSNYAPITFKRNDLQALLTRFKTLTLKFDPVCNVTLSVTENKANLNIKSRNNVVSGSESLAIENPSAGDFEVSFNSQYMLDLISLDQTEDLTIWLNKTNTAKELIRYEGKETTGVIMPVL